MSPSGRFNHRLLYWTVWDKFIQVLYLGRALRTKKTLPDFREKCRVTRHSQVFRGLTGSQRSPGIGASQLGINFVSFYLILFYFSKKKMKFLLLKII